MIKKILIPIGIAIVLVLIGLGFSRPDMVGGSGRALNTDAIFRSLVTTGNLSSSGNLSVTGETVVEGLTSGDGCTTLVQTSATYTLTQAELLASNCFDFTASSTQPALSLALPATSTMSLLLPNAGNRREWIVANNFLGAATTTTIVAGTGIDLQEPDTGDDFNVVIDINNFAWLDCFREANTDVVCRVMETSQAD